MAQNHCIYTMKTRYIGDLDVCQQMVDGSDLNASDCGGVQPSDGICPEDNAVGICRDDQEGKDTVYYSGDPDAIETGCGFQDGEWE